MFEASANPSNPALGVKRNYQLYTSEPVLWVQDLVDAYPCNFDKTPPTVYVMKLDPESCSEIEKEPWSHFFSASDNCTPTDLLAVSYTDSVSQNCGGDYIYVLRHWKVKDLGGNIKSFDQELFVIRATLDQVELPSKVDWFCPTNKLADPDFTGWPSINGTPVTHFCGLTVDYRDYSTKLCGTSVYIRRHWIITDCCSLYAVNYDQDIYYHDTTKPKITCLAPIRWGTNAKECYTHQIVPQIAVLDDCNQDGIDLFVIVDGNAKYVPGQKIILEKGKHTFEYHAIDLCNNESICTVPVEVYDAQGPLLICKPIEVVLTTDSASVCPLSMVTEYWDDCDGLNKVSLKIRKLEDLCGDPFDDLVFKDCISVCCAGGNNFVNVEIEATDHAGNKSTCFTEVKVISQLSLNIHCLDTVRLGCGDLVPNDPPKVIYCSNYTVTSKIVLDTRAGTGIGTVIKRYIVSADNGDKDSCETVYIFDPKASGSIQVFCQNDTVVACGTNFIPRNPTYLIPCSSLKTDKFTKDTIRNKCGIFKIIYKHVITDTLGRKDSCSFMVTFRADSLSCDKIIWPSDTILANCNKSINPDSLKSKPTLTGFVANNCSKPVITFKDSVVAASNGGTCSNKTLRTWTVKDTCSPSAIACSHVQMIQVVDTTRPVIKPVKDTMVFLKQGTGCDTLLSFLGNAMVTDCDPNVSIKNFIIGKGDTLSTSLVRRYAVGTSTVVIIARDACGNTSRDTFVVQVKDTVKPVPVCKKSNQYLKDTGVVRVNARQFDGGSRDNCTSASKLKFSWTPNVNDTILEVNCKIVKIKHSPVDIFLDSVKVFPFERRFYLYVTDEAGNQDTCIGNRFLAFFDTFNICGKNQIINFAGLQGKVETSNGKAIQGVNLSAIGTEQYQTSSTADGGYTMNAVLPGMYKIFPFKNDDSPLGVSTADLIAIQRHILGITSFETMDQFIAADINKDGIVSTVDLLELRKLILGIYSQYPQNTSWRFFDQSLMARTTDQSTVADFENPFVETVEKKISVQNFTGVKIGDVNGSASPQINQLTARSRAQKEIIVPDILLKEGEITELPLTMDVSGLRGAQGSLVFRDADIVGLEYKDALINQPLMINEAKLKEGVLNFAWTGNNENARSGNQILANVYIRAKAPVMTHQILTISRNNLVSESYDTQNQVLDLNLRFDKSTAKSNVDHAVLWQNIPNPFTHETIVNYSLPSTGWVKWSITDVSGKTVQSWSKELAKGDHQEIINKSILHLGGVYYYRLEYNGYTDVKKLIMME